MAHPVPATGNDGSPEAAITRMRALLARWQVSLELHARYQGLDDARYWHVQPWPPHERPAPWIIQLARQKVAELSRQLEEQASAGDAGFAAGLEHMVFLANLVGLQPAGRHIPLADPQNEQREMLSAADNATREMPRPRPPRTTRPQRPTRHAGAPPPRAPARGPSAAATLPPAAAAAGPAGAPLDPASRLVVEDAVRLLQWGRKWHELGELIARIAGRPSVGDARRILRTHRGLIESAAAGKVDGR